MINNYKPFTISKLWQKSCKIVYSKEICFKLTIDTMFPASLPYNLLTITCNDRATLVIPPHPQSFEFLLPPLNAFFWKFLVFSFLQFGYSKTDLGPLKFLSLFKRETFASWNKSNAIGINYSTTFLQNVDVTNLLLVFI